jgi:hypothetical protein
MKFRKQLKKRYVWVVILFRLPVERYYYIRVRKGKNKPITGLTPMGKFG